MVSLRPILHINGALLSFLGLAMLLAGFFGLSVGDADWEWFLMSAFVTFFFGGVFFYANGGEHNTLNRKQAFLFTTVTWILLSLFAALPLYLSSLNLNFIDAFFEAVAGITTTGSTVLNDLDHMPRDILLWRALLQWMGGIGIIGMAISIMPFLKIGGAQVFRTESSDRSDKILPKYQNIIFRMFCVYVLMTVICCLLYYAAGMSFFEAEVHAMTTVSTGGFSTSDASMGHFNSHAITWVSIIFMILASLPFVFYIALMQKNSIKVFKSSQIVALLYTLFICSLLMALMHMYHNHISFFQAFEESVFNVTSIVTTTGYVSEDYTLWGFGAVILFFILTFIGGSSGSTAGGIKIFRWQIMALNMKRHIKGLIYPNLSNVLHYNGKRLSDDTSRSVMSFFIVFALCFVFSVFLLALSGLDYPTAMSGAATALANVGPGIGDTIGPAGNFSSLPDASKWILIGDMLLGRLEFFTILVLFMLDFWR